MKWLFVLLSTFPTFATQLEIVNLTGGPIRITELKDRCGEAIVSKENPIKLVKGGKLVTTVEPVMHFYTVCGFGLCSSSALGFRKGVKRYAFEVRINEYGMIDGEEIPNDWPGNLDCPKEAK